MMDENNGANLLESLIIKFEDSEYAKEIYKIKIESTETFKQNIDKYVEFVSWARWNPDLFFDLITPETGGIRLDLDQRLLMRAEARFMQTYGVFPRGYGKTLIEIMVLIHTAIFYPDIELSMTAQTRENASKLLEEKFRELLKFYPLLQNEILNSSFSRDRAIVEFKSGARIDILANHQSSKGARRKRIVIEESAQLNDLLYQDVLEPIVNVPRRTIGKQALTNPEELNGQINFFTTSWYRGSSEFERNLRLVDDMCELKGKIVLGSDWQLACHYGRGETKSQIMDKKDKLSPTFFALNYCSKWVGSDTNALVKIDKVMSLRTLTRPEFKGDKKSDYVIGVDVARSESNSNNQTSISILKIKRNKNKKIVNIQLVNMLNLPNGLTFSAQAIEVKKIKNLYRAKAVVVDGNGLGKGLIDELLKETFDPNTGESLDCWDTMNTEQEPEIAQSEKVVFNLVASGINSEIIINFIDMIESAKLQLLEKKQLTNYNVDDLTTYNKEIMPFEQTDFLIEEIANLKLKLLNSGKYTVEQVTKRVDKDRYSSLAYALWYISKFENTSESKVCDYSRYVFYN